MQFKIEQIALHPRDPKQAMELLDAMGAGEWAKDHVKARGKVQSFPASNEANLNFEYDMLSDANELEVLQYTNGRSWMDGKVCVSHFGMHVTAAELLYWRDFFGERGIPVAQEVFTTEHTNPHIAGKRWYNYVIFDTFPYLGVDVKFIVRCEEAPE